MNLFDVYPLFSVTPVKAEGSYLWDDQGVRYLDLYGGHAVISVGHSHPRFIAKLTEQLQNIGFYSNSVQIPLQEELATLLGEISGYPDYNLFLCNSGAEANENALKLASFHTGRKKVISFGKAFHGRTSAAVAATDNPSIVAPVNESGNFVFVPFNDEESLDAAFSDEVAAVIIEGIQGVGGINIPSASFLNKIRTLCDKHGSVFICDEVQSGYGRTGKFFAHQHFDVTPDIITVAKGMGNGFPVAGVLISPEIKAKYGMLGTTFGGNYLACAAAIAVLEIIRDEKLVENAAETGHYLVDKLCLLPVIKEIRSLGLMTGIEFDFPVNEIRSKLLRDYRIFTGSSSNKNVLRILPALTVTQSELDYFVESLTRVLS
jgi:acetylornithine aminotransferase